MKKILIGIFVFSLAIWGTSCAEDAAKMIAGLGGPDESPQLTEEEEALQEPADEEDLNAGIEEPDDETDEPVDDGTSPVAAGEGDVSDDEIAGEGTEDDAADELLDLAGDEPADNEQDTEVAGPADTGSEDKTTLSGGDGDGAGMTVDIDISEGKWYKADGSPGIRTNWKGQPVYLAIGNVPEAGYYEITVTAKNYGVLPDFYDFFNLSVTNENSGKDIGGILIPASEKKFNSGVLQVYLEEGDNTLKLVWNNDAYKKGVYDANILIKGMLVTPSKREPVKNRLMRRADEYSAVDGRFFWGNNSVWTYWDNQHIGFNFPDLEPGKYEVIIFARNYRNRELPAPQDYPAFKVRVDGDGTDGIAEIPFTESGFRKASTVLDLTGGDTEIFFTWLNDKYRAGEFDANIEISKIMLKRVGDSERSALVAYLLGTETGNRVLLFGTLTFVLFVLGIIFMWNRQRALTL